jgi:hypothetical protein
MIPSTMLVISPKYGLTELLRANTQCGSINYLTASRVFHAREILNNRIVREVWFWARSQQGSMESDGLVQERSTNH